MKEVLPLSNGKALQITETALSDEEGTYPFAKMTDIRTLDDEDDEHVHFVVMCNGEHHYTCDSHHFQTVLKIIDLYHHQGEAPKAKVEKAQKPIAKEHVTPKKTLQEPVKSSVNVPLMLALIAALFLLIMDINNILTARTGNHTWAFELGVTIGMLAMRDFLILLSAGIVFNSLGLFMKNQILTLIGAIIYSVAILFTPRMVLWQPFIPAILGWLGYLKGRR